MRDKKRKQNPAPEAGPGSKKSKRNGNNGMWKTSNQLGHLNKRFDMARAIELDDAGFWVTCVRHAENKAITEMMDLCDKLGEKWYGIKPPVTQEEQVALAKQEENGDIEATIQAELDEMKRSSKKPAQEFTFLPVKSGLDCVFFVKTRKPVDPVDFAHRFCQDAESYDDPKERPLRHINKLSPVVCMGSSLDTGLEKTARRTLSEVFQLKPEEVHDQSHSPKQNENGEPTTEYSYAIRHSIRASPLQREDVINRVAAVVGPKHKVNLTSPDKVILVEIYKNFCGMSVVDGKEYERLRRYNIHEIYKLVDNNKKT